MTLKAKRQRQEKSGLFEREKPRRVIDVIVG
jgi:hypothetical protein